MNNVYEAPQSNLNMSGENNSGQGKVEDLPESIKGWIWGHFYLIGYGLLVINHG